GDTVTDATGTWVTVIVDGLLAGLPGYVAVTLLVPTATPVTRPDVEALATPGREGGHGARRLPHAHPVIGMPAGAFGVAVRRTVGNGTREADVGATPTLVTGTSATVTADVPATP